jgi:hypothetical protein
MAVTVVTVGNAINSAAAGFAGTMVDVSARVSTNVNCLVVVAAAGLTVQSARWDVCAANTTMSTAGESNRSASVTEKAFFLMNPAGGEHILRVLVSGTTAGKFVGYYALSSAANVGTIGAFLAQNGTTDDVSAQVASTANEVVIDGNYFGDVSDVSAAGVLSAGTGQTQAYNRKPTGSTINAMAGSWQTGETSTRMSWGENFGTLCPWANLAFNVVATGAAAVGGGVRPCTLPLTGVGR